MKDKIRSKIIDLEEKKHRVQEKIKKAVCHVDIIFLIEHLDSLKFRLEKYYKRLN